MCKTIHVESSELDENDEGLGKVKVKVSLEGSMQARKWSRGITPLFLQPRR
jgi:hypothetical protein